MVYSNKFIMCLLLNGVPQKELENGIVQIPFDSEYSLRFRNKNSRRAMVQIFIDGENVSGNGYVVPANSYVDIRRHFAVDSSFKFVSLESPDAIEFGKNGPNTDKEKGTIEARFYLEKEIIPAVSRRSGLPLYDHHSLIHRSTKTKTCGYPENFFGNQNSNNQMELDYHDYDYSTKLSPNKVNYSCELSKSGLSFDEEQYTKTHIKNSVSLSSSKVVKDGCTVEGFATGQNFTQSYFNPESHYTSVKIFLQGFEEEVPQNSIIQEVDKKSVDLQLENQYLKQQIKEKLKLKIKDKQKELEIENAKLWKQLEELEA